MTEQRVARAVTEVYRVASPGAGRIRWAATAAVAFLDGDLAVYVCDDLDDLRVFVVGLAGVRSARFFGPGETPDAPTWLAARRHHPAAQNRSGAESEPSSEGGVVVRLRS